MARVKIEEIVNHLDNEFKQVLSKTIDTYFPEKSYDINEVFQMFKEMIYQQCSIWENVPDSYVGK